MGSRALLVAAAAGCGGGTAPVKAPAPTTPACDAYFGSEPVTTLLGQLGRLDQVRPIWGSYRPADQPVVLVGPAHPAEPTCALIWKQGAEVERLALDGPVQIPIQIYWFHSTVQAGPDALPEFAGIGRAMQGTQPQLAAALARHGIERTVILRTDFDPAVLPALGVELDDHYYSLALMRLLWILHESFHLQSQFPTWLDQEAPQPWPAWDRQPDRDAVVETCYGGVEAALASAEHAALRDALDDPCAGAAAFLAERFRRHAGLGDASVTSPVGPMTCPVAEAVMELEEGVADYLAVEAALDRELMTPAQSLAAFDARVLPPFYGYGRVQLQVLERLIGRDAMLAETAALATSASPDEGITGVLTRNVKRHCPGR
jgi:hypothetical protein